MHIVATNEKEKERKRSRKIPRVLAEATEWIMLPFSEIQMPERVDLCVCGESKPEFSFQQVDWSCLCNHSGVSLEFWAEDRPSNTDVGRRGALGPIP